MEVSRNKKASTLRSRISLKSIGQIVQLLLTIQKKIVGSMIGCLLLTTKIDPGMWWGHNSANLY